MIREVKTKKFKVDRTKLANIKKNRMKSDDKRRIRKTGMLVRLCLSLAIFVGTLHISALPVQAWEWDNARTYYLTYGDSVVFHPETYTDGTIYYATKAKIATTSTRFTTLGWKFTVTNTSGKKLQTLYFKLGGSYMYGANTVRKGNYEYNLYMLSLYQLKSRLNTKASNALKTGQAAIRLDACMTIVKNGSVKGRMDDNGSFSGKVYTSYSGITSAANWSPTARQMLNSYFDKYVEGLFLNVNVVAGEGIKSVTGSGIYCYGTYVEVQATPKDGYDFANWSGLVKDGSMYAGFFVNESGICIAEGEPKFLRVYYHRNQTEQDSGIEVQMMQYQKSGAELYYIAWTKKDKLPLGWALSASASNAKFRMGQHVSANWIAQHTPEVHLYAVWDDTDPDPTTPDPPGPTPNPPGPTPDPPGPTPDPPSPTPDPKPEVKETDNKKTTTKKIVRCRFISSQYFEDEHENLIPQERGGLAPDSVWATDSVRRQILRYALRQA